MKKHILSFALVAAIFGSIATGCSSAKKTTGSDSTSTDTTKVKKQDTTKKDTGKTSASDTTKKM